MLRRGAGRFVGRASPVWYTRVPARPSRFTSATRAAVNTD